MKRLTILALFVSYLPFSSYAELLLNPEESDIYTECTISCWDKYNFAEGANSQSEDIYYNNLCTDICRAEIINLRKSTAAQPSQLSKLPSDCISVDWEQTYSMTGAQLSDLPGIDKATVHSPNLTNKCNVELVVYYRNNSLRYTCERERNYLEANESGVPIVGILTKPGERAEIALCYELATNPGNCGSDKPSCPN